MPHPLEDEYGLTSEELLDAINRRFRAKVTLEGAVAEVHLGKQIGKLKDAGVIERFEAHDKDGHPDYTIWLPGSRQGQLVECKNVRNSDEAYRKNGVSIAFKVETQKTRTSKGDPSTRFYDHDHFAILAVCLGKKTHQWNDFIFVRTRHLARHKKFPHKFAVNHKVPLPTSTVLPPWYRSLEQLLAAEPQ